MQAARVERPAAGRPLRGPLALQIRPGRRARAGPGTARSRARARRKARLGTAPALATPAPGSARHRARGPPVTSSSLAAGVRGRGRGGRRRTTGGGGRAVSSAAKGVDARARPRTHERGPAGRVGRSRLVGVSRSEVVKWRRQVPARPSPRPRAPASGRGAFLNGDGHDRSPAARPSSGEMCRIFRESIG